MKEQTIDAYALSDFMRDHWQERLDEELRVKTLIRPDELKKWDTLHMCLNVIGLARWFYHDAYGWRPDDGCKDPDTTRLLRLGEEAKIFRAAFDDIGLFRLGATKVSNVTRAQSLRELEATTNWLKKKGLRSWLVARNVEGAKEWQIVEPRTFSTQIFSAIQKADNRREEIKRQQEAEESKGKAK